MTKKSETSAEIARLDDVLAIYGADPRRWPVGERDALKALVAGDTRAARMVSEAAALDRLMASASAGNAGPDLKQRIVAAAASDAEHEARIVPIMAGRGLRRDGFNAGSGTIWSATAMAACFALGLYLGVAGTGTSALDAALQLASLSSSGEESVSIDVFSDSDVIESEGLI